MTKLEDDGDFELQTKRWTELIGLRQALTGHKMDPAGVDIAIANVFYPKKGHIIDSIIIDGKDLMAIMLQLEELQIDSTNVKMTLAKAFVPGASGTYAADLIKLKGMIKMREQMSGMGIPIGGIEAAIADVFKPLPAPANFIKPEEASETSVTKQPSPTAETIEPVELDASSTAITKQSTTGISKPAELEASETAVITRSLPSTGAAKPVESMSKDTETGKPAEMPSQLTAMQPPSPNAEHITIIGTSIEAMDLDSSPATASPPLTKEPAVLTSPPTVRSTPSTKTASSFSSPSTTRSKSSAKQSAPNDTGDALGSAQNPICLGSSPAPKRQRTANNVLPRAALEKTESWKVPIQSVGIMGLHLKPRYDDADLSIDFDVETQRVVFYKGQKSLTGLYSDLEINPEALLSVIRPTYTQSKNLKVRFIWQDTNGEETFLDIMVATKQDCRDLIARLKDTTSFSEILLSERHMNKLCEGATWLVNETQNAVGVSVTKFSENVWLD